MLEAFLVATGIVALSEVGDKTQLLAFMLAARYRKPWPIVLGILVATIANHAAAAGVGVAVTRFIGPDVLRWLLGGAFLAMSVWILIPDDIDAEDAERGSHGVFMATVIAFFLAEMGDKTQIATVALAAQYQAAAVAVVIGTTLGMMIANVPAVLIGDRLAYRLPVRAVHAVAALIFALLGLAILLGFGTDIAF